MVPIVFSSFKACSRQLCSPSSITLTWHVIPNQDTTGTANHIKKKKKKNRLWHLSMSDGHAAVSWSSLPRKDQLFLLFMIRFSEPVVRVSIGAYIYYQLKSLDPALSSAEVITQSAYLQTAYTIAQAISSLLWGVVSDSPRGGRKLVVLTSLSGSCKSTLQ